MSSTSRKVRNPLLSAAGMGSPFEYYPENALLVPVTPATPAVLRDDAELDNFVGQETNQSQNSSVNQTVSKNELDGENLLANKSVNSEESKLPTNQPTKQGYFTSILSSLPNLSLSSIKADSLGSQGSQGVEITTGKRDINPYSVPQSRNGSLSETSSFIAANPHDPYGVNQSGSGEANIRATTSVAPPQPTFPPTIPISTGPVSYRLGNQRRLKYAPPPDLTSNNTKQYPNPPVPDFFSPSNVLTPSSILNPNTANIEQQISNNSPALSQTSVIPPSEQIVTPEQRSQSTSLHGSFRSSPSTIGHSSNSNVNSQNSFGETPLTTGPSGYSVSSSRSIPPRNLDPATPQNTPANSSFSFDLYANQPNHFMRFGSTYYNKKDQEVSNNQYTNSQDIFKQESSNPTLDVSKAQSFVSPVVNTFKPISVDKVKEKLEHFLAEQKEESPSGTSSEFSSEVANITPQNENEIKTLNFNNIIQPSGESNEESNKIKSNGEPSNANLSKSDSLSDIPLNQNSFDITVSLENPEDLRKTQRITFDTKTSQLNLTPQLQQSNQTQALPILPLDNIFPEKTTETDKNINPRSIQEESKSNSTFVDFSNTFIEPAENTTNYSLFQPQQSDINTNFNQVSNIELHKKEEYPSFNQYSTNTVSTIPQSIWNNNKNIQIQNNDSTRNDQPPQFYNPAQLMAEAYKYQYPASIYVPTTNSVFNSQTHTFVAQASKLEESRNIVSDNDFIYAQHSFPMTTAVPEPTGSATLSPIQLSASPFSGHTTPDGIPLSLHTLPTGVSTGRMQYKVINHHWFYRKEVENKVLWVPFSTEDSSRLETVHNSSEITTETTVATDGGRYDVDILRRRRSPVYWSGPSTEVRRCSWFYKGPSESKYIPYDESIAAKLEEEFKHACITSSWNRRIDLNNGEYIIFHSETVHVHYLQTNSSDASTSWTNPTDSEDGTYLQGGSIRQRMVKRGVIDFNIDNGEPEKIDHLLFVVHGVGSACDLKFRSVEEVVDEFRSISLQLVQSHYHTASKHGIVNRIEVLPISWHTSLHSDTGIDKKLKAITLESIPKLRHFTNDTLLDVLFYTSPTYCETIMQTVGNEMNRLYALFKERNPDFDGGVYLGGHSLGSLIMFDLLCHQKSPVTEEKEEEEEEDSEVNAGKENENLGPIQSLQGQILKRRLSKKISYVIGIAGTGQPYIHYPQINFHPRAFFAFGSPIGMFVTIRGIDTLGENFALPTCPAFFHIFHPFDPVAYRVESLINPEAYKYRPMLIPHHKGRKRMHLELKETMARVGADLKQKLIDSVRSTWNSFYQLAFHKPDDVLEREIDRVVEEQLKQIPNESEQPSNDDGGADIKMGKLNGGRRIDYVLQEAPLECINEYLFALTSHVCYWESEDTILMILKEIYGSMGIQTDAQLPQQTLTIERPSLSSSPSISSSFKSDTTVPVIGMDSKIPISNIGPPPITGFVRKS